MSCQTTITDVSVLFTGVGGQGILLAGDVLAAVAFEADLDVKKSEIRGLSRRFGSVWCQVRLGEEVHSPVRGLGAVDHLVALEMQEGLRRLPYLKPEGTALINKLWIDSNGTSLSKPPQHFDASQYPRCCWLPGTEISSREDQRRSLNFFMLGALAALLPFEDETWMTAIESVVQPRFLPANRQMFQAGAQAYLDQRQRPRKPK